MPICKVVWPFASILGTRIAGGSCTDKVIEYEVLLNHDGLSVPLAVSMNSAGKSFVLIGGVTGSRGKTIISRLASMVRILDGSTRERTCAVAIRVYKMLGCPKRQEPDINIEPASNDGGRFEHCSGTGLCAKAHLEMTKAKGVICLGASGQAGTSRRGHVRSCDWYKNWTEN